MSELLTLPELQDELRKMQQAYDNDDITGPQFEAAAADLHTRIKARELVVAKNRATDKLDAMKKAEQLGRVEYTRARMAIHNAKNDAELAAIQYQISAA